MHLFFKRTAICFIGIIIFYTTCVTRQYNPSLENIETGVWDISESDFEIQYQSLISDMLKKKAGDIVKLLKAEISEISTQKSLLYENEINSYIEQIDLIKYYKLFDKQILPDNKIKITYTFHQDWLKQEILDFFEQLPEPLVMPDLYLDFEDTNNPYFRKLVYRQSQTQELIDIKALMPANHKFILANHVNISDTSYTEQDFICIEYADLEYYPFFLKYNPLTSDIVEDIYAQIEKLIKDREIILNVNNLEMEGKKYIKIQPAEENNLVIFLPSDSAYLSLPEDNGSENNSKDISKEKKTGSNSEMDAILPENINNHNFLTNTIEIVNTLISQKEYQSAFDTIVTLENSYLFAINDNEMKRNSLLYYKGLLYFLLEKYEQAFNTLKEARNNLNTSIFDYIDDENILNNILIISNFIYHLPQSPGLLAYNDLLSDIGLGISVTP